MSALSTVVDRIRSEYLALPGLKLTPAQARRLWPSTDGVLEDALRELVAEGFLRYLPSGTYISVPRPHAAKADLEARVTDALEAMMRCPHCYKLNAQHVSSIRCVACGRVITSAAAVPA
jgi:hypothetical protein